MHLHRCVQTNVLIYVHSQDNMSRYTCNFVYVCRCVPMYVCTGAYVKFVHMIWALYVFLYVCVLLCGYVRVSTNARV